MPLQLDFLASPLLRDLLAISPELLMVLGMSVLLFVRLFATFDRCLPPFSPC